MGNTEFELVDEEDLMDDIIEDLRDGTLVRSIDNSDLKMQDA